MIDKYMRMCIYSDRRIYPVASWAIRLTAFFPLSVFVLHVTLELLVSVEMYHETSFQISFFFFFILKCFTNENFHTLIFSETCNI